MSALLELDRVSRSFKGLRAVDDVSLDVERLDEIIGVDDLVGLGRQRRQSSQPQARQVSRIFASRRYQLDLHALASLCALAVRRKGRAVRPWDSSC